ncbi:MAG TPA: hypothetical protein VL263_02570 [Vicinamibacterales bacterium]|jgi:hypothetical protein|nr:hypothetical protein [Vicinamibacterales bacterium]
MIKRIRPATPVTPEEWPDLADSVEVEVTSEHPDSPIEHALVGRDTSGWRAGAPGVQTISLTWPEPRAITRIRLVCEEHSVARTQEFALRAFGSGGRREIVRQQFTFSPPETTLESEEYGTGLDAVSRLELVITPAIGGGDAVATLRELRVK